MLEKTKQQTNVFIPFSSYPDHSCSMKTIYNNVLSHFKKVKIFSKKNKTYISSSSSDSLTSPDFDSQPIRTL